MFGIKKKGFNLEHPKYDPDIKGGIGIQANDPKLDAIAREERGGVDIISEGRYVVGPASRIPSCQKEGCDGNHPLIYTVTREAPKKKLAKVPDVFYMARKPARARIDTEVDEIITDGRNDRLTSIAGPVSYTHLTLPTIYSV